MWTNIFGMWCIKLPTRPECVENDPVDPIRIQNQDLNNLYCQVNLHIHFFLIAIVILTIRDAFSWESPLDGVTCASETPAHTHTGGQVESKSHYRSRREYFYDIVDIGGIPRKPVRVRPPHVALLSGSKQESARSHDRAGTPCSSSLSVAPSVGCFPPCAAVCVSVG